MAKSVISYLPLGSQVLHAQGDHLNQITWGIDACETSIEDGDECHDVRRDIRISRSCPDEFAFFFRAVQLQGIWMYGADMTVAVAMRSRIA
jgi:hypothetical protein